MILYVLFYEVNLIFTIYIVRIFASKINSDFEDYL